MAIILLSVGEESHQSNPSSSSSIERQPNLSSSPCPNPQSDSHHSCTEQPTGSDATDLCLETEDDVGANSVSSDGVSKRTEKSGHLGVPSENRNDITDDSFERAMANAEELEEKWILTFEQFVGVLQREPVLCQFFAEQNNIDLSGTNVDPVLNPYTRTIMAASP